MSGNGTPPAAREAAGSRPHAGTDKIARIPASYQRRSYS
jgi:hypothetical protein